MDKIILPKEVEYEEIQTEHGIFTSNTYLGLTAQEVYEKWLYDKENPQPIEPTLEEQVEILQEENKNLKIEQEQQNEEILVNMLANTEMFEMLLSMMPMILSEDKNTKNNGGNSMIEVYCTLIIKNVKTIEDVPLVIREQVIERLKQLEVPVK